MLFVKKDILVLDNQKVTSSFEKIKLRIKLKDIEMVILSYYRPPVPESFKPFIEDVEDEMMKYNGNKIIVGDVNLDSNCDNIRNASGRIIDHLTMNFMNKFNIQNHTIKNTLSDHNIIISHLKGIKTVTNNAVIKIERNNSDKLRENFNALMSQSSIVSS